ncbi:MAG: SMP-30/gluconolactonase/LRE family protein [Thermoplasmata archaeon]|uniref:SMP-30/gluconolactonase/LRE family protein n=1 Tax=Candidatus Sysuiplasma superficiale TaxID=2823368 RepID=A0A8J8CDT1_9ARCH|nr:SMP-30/gluconolactonase/LRE family protein [Candidatus Sysuiplasma superficiale]MBX8643986.1 SMP-30/gluconolactonase/LRE family protein [Candidatus Sysuiplasma superficiale]
MIARQIFASECSLAEGPLWDCRTNRLYWVDILKGSIHSIDPVDMSHRVHRSKDFVSCIVPKDGGGFIISAGTSLYAWDGDSGEVLISSISEPPNNRFNDGKCDGSGRLWIGTMDIAEKSPSGNLYRFDRDRKFVKVASGFTVSNGIDWSPDDATMYHVDSPSGCVYSYDFEPSTGVLSNRQIFVKIPPEKGFPDGITVDSEGNLYVAHWGGSGVSVWNSEGKNIGFIEIPALNVSSCSFGGPDLEDLYITTAKNYDNRERADTNGGGIFSIRTGAKGFRANSFDW